MVAAVVQFQGLCGQVRLQGAGKVGQGRQFDRHGQVRGQRGGGSRFHPLTMAATVGSLADHRGRFVRRSKE
ncbi:hypothetical protein SM139_1789 [Stenotrophomonas maltophilia]|nr:hypothetical protein SM139_1789 [Stenotrophomonas maltophilia]